MMAQSVVSELARAFHCPDVRQLEIHALRAAFAELMDAAAAAVHAAGLELDDCVLERYADIRETLGGEVRIVELDMLSDREACIRSLVTADQETRPTSQSIVGVRLRVIRGDMLDPFGFGVLNT
jgi:hypothetical protein